jgi:hypothetical protein
MFKIQGILFHVGLIQRFSSNLIKKDFIVSRMGGGAYPNLVFEVLGDDIKKLDALSLNSMIEVSFDIHGKSYTAKDGKAKHFNILRAYNIEIVNTIPVVPAVVEETLTEKA